MSLPSCDGGKTFSENTCGPALMIGFPWQEPLLVKNFSLELDPA